MRQGGKEKTKGKREDAAASSTTEPVITLPQQPVFSQPPPVAPLPSHTATLPKSEVIRIKRFHYIHILDNNTNVIRTLVGPLVYTRKEHESCLFDPLPCVSVPPRSFCVILNPCVRRSDGSVVEEENGQVRLRMGDKEIRLEGDPFALYPGEAVETINGKAVQPLEVIPANSGFRVRCVRDFKSGDAVITAGTEWMEEGPKTYIPRVEVRVVEKVNGSVIRPNEALLVRARINFTDRTGVKRVAGETWLVRTAGAYLPDVNEEVEKKVSGVVLSNQLALQLRAVRDFTDVYNRPRKAGDCWLVTNEDAAVHIVDVNEAIIKEVSAIKLSAQQFCIVLHPVDETGKNRYGERLMKRGECSFFLHPGEELRDGVQSVMAAGKGEALLLMAMSTFTDDTGVVREAGTTWMLHGPAELSPMGEVSVLEYRKVIALDKNEGVYVMDTVTGDVRAVIGEPYMLKESEVLWEKQLPLEVEELLQHRDGSLKTSERNPKFVSTREKHRIVRFNVQHNAAVQIYDYRKKVQRMVLGPSLVILEPHEEFTVLSLSGGTPKAPNAFISLQLFLGPRFSSDTIIVETSDHARLQLRLSYNWYFDVKRDEKQHKTFSVPDFIGDCCKTIASRVRGAVAAEAFDSFHRNSAQIIRTAVFGTDENGDVRKELRFTANDFVVTNIDVQSVEPTDEKTRDSLQKSVQLAIEITTKSQEAAARHGNELKDQEAKGQLERQKLRDKIEVENAKTKWLELQAKSEAVQASGQSVAEAKAKAESLVIEAESEFTQAQLRAKAYLLSAETELKKLQQRQAMELEYNKRQNEMEIEKARGLAEMEADKVRRMVDAIGRETLVAIAQAGPEMQAKLLAGLGLKGYLVTDGNSPVNLFDTAMGMIGGGGGAGGAGKP